MNPSNLLKNLLLFSTLIIGSIPASAQENTYLHLAQKCLNTAEVDSILSPYITSGKNIYIPENNLFNTCELQFKSVKLVCASIEYLFFMNEQVDISFGKFELNKKTATIRLEFTKSDINYLHFEFKLIKDNWELQEVIRQ